MPELDVSFMCADPMFADTFTVTRRADVVDSKGRTTPTNSVVTSDVVGTVTQEDIGDLMRNPDAEFNRRRIMVCTSFPLRDVTTGFQPDVITWPQTGSTSTTYLVVKVLPYSRFGAGTYEAICEATAATAPP